MIELPPKYHVRPFLSPNSGGIGGWEKTRHGLLNRLEKRGWIALSLTVEQWIMLVAAAITLILLIFVVDWRYFRDWVVILLFKSLLDFVWGSPVENLKLIEYPVRLLPKYYDTSILFELWVFPVLCVLYNQVTRERGLGPIILFALLFSAGMTAIEHVLEQYTDLIRYLDWSWFTTFYTLTITFLLSRTFIAFFRWGCDYFGGKQRIR